MLTLDYFDGVIQSSKRTGSVNFEKKYYYKDNGTVLNSVETKTDKGTAEFAKTDLPGYDSGSKITKDGKLVKQTYELKDTIIVNDFDKETGIIKQSTVFDKNSKTKKVIQSDALKNVEEIRAKNSTIEGKIIESETWESGALKKAKFEDGTIKKYNSEGNLIEETRPDGRTSTLICSDNISYEKLECCSGQFDISKHGYALDFGDGHKKYYDKNGVLRIENFSDGSYKAYYQDGALEKEFITIGQGGDKMEYYPSGQIEIFDAADGTYKKYREDGTLESISKHMDGMYGTCVEYNADGLTKKYERFADGSRKKYT